MPFFLVNRYHGRICNESFISDSTVDVNASNGYIIGFINGPIYFPSYIGSQSPNSLAGIFSNGTHWILMSSS